MAARRLIATVALAVALPATADSIPPAYRWVAAQAGIPASVLFAVALQESGTRLRGHTMSWPWTLNKAGTPQRFATRQQACSALIQALWGNDPKRVDVGLGQTNMGYHPDRYTSACDALDPHANLAVTAALLREHREAARDWAVAAGRYHRPAGGEPAARYRAQFLRHWLRVEAAPLNATEPRP